MNGPIIVWSIIPVGVIILPPTCCHLLTINLRIIFFRLRSLISKRIPNKNDSLYFTHITRKQILKTFSFALSSLLSISKLKKYHLLVHHVHQISHKIRPQELIWKYQFLCISGSNFETLKWVELAKEIFYSSQFA